MKLTDEKKKPIEPTEHYDQLNQDHYNLPDDFGLLAGVIIRETLRIQKEAEEEVDVF